MKIKNDRDSNIELLRVFTMIGVVMLHINNSQMGGLFNAVGNNKLFVLVLNLFESISVCAVNIFVIISSWFLSKTTKRNVFKVLELVFQVTLISVVFYLISIVNTSEKFSLMKLCSVLILKNWFVVLYIVLYLISPFLNILTDNLSKKKLYIISCNIIFDFFSLSNNHRFCLVNF